MRYNRNLTVIAAGLALLLSNCGPAVEEPTRADIQSVLEKISGSALGFRIETADADIGIAPLSGGRGDFEITLNNPSLSIGEKIFRQLDLPVRDFKLPVAFQELVLSYRPSDARLRVLSAREMSYTLDMADFIQAEESGEEGETVSMVPEMRIRYRIGSMRMENLDITPLLDEEERTVLEELIGLLGANPAWTGSIGDMRVDIEADNDDLKRLTWTADAAESRLAAHPELLKTVLQPDESATSLEQLLEKGQSLWDMKAGLKNMRMSLETAKESIEVELGNLDIAYFLDPAENNASYKFGFNWDVGGFFLTGLKQKAVEKMAGLERLNIGFSMDGLSPTFLRSYFGMLQTARKAGMAQDDAARQEMGMQGLALVGSLAQSKPTISLSVRPFEHRIGKMEAEGNFRFIRMGPPIGKGTVRIFNLEEVGKALAAEKIIPEDKVADIMTKLEGLFQREGRDGVLTFEIKQDDTKHFYLNGRPMSF